MEKEIKQLIQAAKTMRLSQREKDHSRARVAEFMEQHPLGPSATRYEKAFDRSLQRSFFMRKKRYTLLPITLIVSILLGGTVSYAAENALPGDILYPVKITVNEGVQNLLAVSVESRAELQVELTNKRLKEAEALALEGRLNAETQAKVEAQFKAHTENVQKLVNKLEEEEDAEERTDVAAQVHTSLASVLDAHEDVLVRIKERSDDNGADTDKESKKRALEAIIVNVRNEAEVASSTSLKLQSSLTAKTSERMQKGAEEKRKASENKINEVKKFLSKVETSIGAETKGEVNARLEAAENSLVSGDAQREGGAYFEAFSAYQNAIKLAQEAKLIAEIEKELKVSDSNRSGAKKEKKEKDRTERVQRKNGLPDNSATDDKKREEIRGRPQADTPSSVQGTETMGTKGEIESATTSVRNEHDTDRKDEQDEEDDERKEDGAQIEINTKINTDINVNAGI